MITTYKIKIIEGEKTVKQEIELEGTDKEEIINETKDVYNKLKPFCLNESLKKAGIIK